MIVNVLTLVAAYMVYIGDGNDAKSDEMLMTTPFLRSTIPGIIIEHILVTATTLALIMRSQSRSLKVKIVLIMIEIFLYKFVTKECANTVLEIIITNKI